ncbi:MAG: glutathione S-transferase C-terminal domain-containing protein [Acidimicrobiales bacterium]
MRPVTLKGAFSSPYTLKMRAVLRYRRIPYRWVLRGSEWDDLPEAKVPVIPVIGFHNDDGSVEVMTDSSPQITRLESEYEGRSLVPSDAALAFIDFLLEDYADEWVTKAMYHYRWTYEPDIEKSGRLLPLDRDLHASDENLRRSHDFIIDRQVGRRALVGSTEANLPIIEGSYERLLDLLQRLLSERPFLLGARPGRADFALFGQLVPMTWWDPTPMAIAVERAPRVVNWIQRVDDLSWWPLDEHDDGDGGWVDVAALPEIVHEILCEAGSTYAPFMIANAAALEAGADEVACEISGLEYRQAPFRYQPKCLQWLRQEYGALDDASRAVVDSILSGTGCDRLVA